jgi:ribonucleoside-diphosphate reductase alpha chain
MPSTQSATDRRTGTASAGVSEGGLTIERRFTRAGDHPFDMIDWELRTAEVGGFKQEEVEFPATW